PRANLVQKACRSGLGAAQPAVVLGDRFLVALRELDRGLGAHRMRPAAAAIALADLQLYLLGQVHQGAELSVDELGVAAQPPAQRIPQAPDRLKLLVRQPLPAQPCTQSQQLAACILEASLELCGTL